MRKTRKRGWTVVHSLIQQIFNEYLLFCIGLRLSITNVAVESAIMVLILIARHPPAITIRKQRKDTYYLQGLEITQHTWGHSTLEATQQGARWEPGVSLVYSSSVNLK